MKLGIYDYFSEISDINKLYFIFILSFTLFIFTTISPLTLAQLGAIIIAFLFFLFYQDKQFSHIDTFNREMEYKLNYIKRLVRKSKTDRPGFIKRKDYTDDPEFLHHDADIINLLYNIRDFHEYNSASFELIVKSINNVLKLHFELKKIITAIQQSDDPGGEIRRGAGRSENNLDVIDENISDAMNHYHSLIISIPSNLVLDKKHLDNQHRLHILLKRHRDDSFRLCRKLQKYTGYHIDRKVISNIGPRPSQIYNNPANSHFDYFN